MKREIMRKSVHIFFGTIFLLLVALTGTTTSLLAIGLCFAVGNIISIAIRRGYKVPLLEKIVLNVERENEKHFPGKAAVMFFASALVLLVLFKDYPMIVLASLSVQVFADAAAALVGIPFGKHKLYKKKSWEGTTACFVVATACLLFFYPIHIALIAAFVATLIEVLPLDDNLWIPIGTGIALKLLA